MDDPGLFWPDFVAETLKPEDTGAKPQTQGPSAQPQPQGSALEAFWNNPIRPCSTTGQQRLFATAATPESSKCTRSRLMVLLGVDRDAFGYDFHTDSPELSPAVGLPRGIDTVTTVCQIVS